MPEIPELSTREITIPVPPPVPPGTDSTPDAFAKARRWQLIWPQIIAKAWADPKFKEELIWDPRKTIKDHFNYELSEELDLTIRVAPAGTPGYNPQAAKNQDAWKGLPKMKLELCIPPIPPVEQQAIAVTAYGDTGRTYPMTSG